MVKVKKAALHKSLAYIEANSKVTKSEPLVGQVTDNGSLGLFQTGFVRVWDKVELDEDSEPMFFTVPCSHFMKIVDACSSKQISLRVSENKLHLSSGKSRIHIPFYSSPETEILPPPEVETTMVLGGEFAGALGEAAVFLARTEEKPMLSCYSIHQLKQGVLRIVASNDSFHLYQRDMAYTGDQFDPIVLPRECGQTLSKVFNKSTRLSMGITANGVVVITELDGTRVLATPQFNGSYADVTELVDTTKNKLFTVSRKSLLDMCKLSSHMTDSGLMSFQGVDGDLRVYFPKTQTVDGELYLDDAEIVRDFPRIYFNVRFVMNCLNVLDDDEIMFSSIAGKYTGGAFVFSGSTNRQPNTYLYKVPYTDTD